jgi:hypothetical protein
VGLVRGHHAGILAAASLTLLAACGGGGTPAVPVADVVDSLGVCTHIGQGVDDAVRVAAALSYLGVRNIRDDASAAHVSDWMAVHRLSGARVDLITNHDLGATVRMAEQLRAAHALLAVEGPNEPNNWPVRYRGQTSDANTFVPVAYFQRDLYKAVHTSRALRGIPVFASSEAGGSEPDNVGLQYLTIPRGAHTRMPAGTRYADYANTHTYVMGHVGHLIDNMPWQAADPTLDGPWDGLYAEYGRTWRKHYPGYSAKQLVTLPRVMTETGWTTRGDGSIGEELQGRILLDVYLANFKRGWKYTFVYMLRDDPVQGYWGLVRTDYTPKPAGTYLHNLTAILADPGTGTRRRRPGRLRYTVPDQPATVHDLLMQKSNGKFVLAVWDERVVGSDEVTVDLDRTYAEVAIYDPTVGPSPVQVLHGVRSLHLTLGGYQTLLAEF